jgi:hypothetical protein
MVCRVNALLMSRKLSEFGFSKTLSYFWQLLTGNDFIFGYIKKLGMVDGVVIYRKKHARIRSA